MRIFSKRAFQFDHPTGDQPPVVVQPLNFADVPEWVNDSAMFQWASQDGDVEVIGNKQDEVAAEVNASNNKKSTKSDDPATPQQ